MSGAARPLAFLKTARRCRGCGTPHAAGRGFPLCDACGPPQRLYEEPGEGAAPAFATNRLARRRRDIYAAVLNAAEAAGWVLYRHHRSDRSLSLYLEYYRPDAPADPAAFRKVRVSDHDRRPKPGGAGFRDDWADLHAEFLFDAALPGPEAAEALADVQRSAAAAFAWPAGGAAPGP